MTSSPPITPPPLLPPHRQPVLESMESCTYDIYIKTIAGCPSECPTPFVSVTGVRSRRRRGSYHPLSCASLPCYLAWHPLPPPLSPPPRLLLQGSQQMLCGGHGVCGYDAKEGNSRCFCNDGFAGADCTGSPEQPPKGLSTLGGVLIGIGLLLGLLIAGLAYLWLRIRALVSGGAGRRMGGEDGSVPVAAHPRAREWRGRMGEDGGTVNSTLFPVIFHCAAPRPHGVLVAAGRPRGGGRGRHWLGRVGQQGGRPVVEVA